MPTHEEEQEALRAIHQDNVSDFVDTWRQSIEAKKKRGRAARSRPNKKRKRRTEEPEPVVQDDHDSQHLLESSANFVRAITQGIDPDEPFLRFLSPDFRANLGFPTFPGDISFDGLARCIEKLRREHPEWCYRYGHSLIDLQKDKRVASVYTVLKQDGIPPGKSQEVVMKMNYRLTDTRWLLHRLRSIAMIDYDHLFADNKSPGSHRIARERLEALNSPWAATPNATAPNISSSCLVSQDDLISRTSSLNQSVMTQATNSLDRWIEDQPKSHSNTPPESVMNGVGTPESLPFGNDGGFQGFTACGSAIPAVSPSCDRGQSSDQGDSTSASLSDADQSTTDSDSLHDEASPETNIVHTISQSCAQASRLSNVRSDRLYLARHDSLPLTVRDHSLIPKPFTRNVRAVSCPTRDHSSRQTVYNSRHSASGDSDESDECSSDSMTSTSCDDAEGHDDFAEAALFRLHSEINVLLQQSHRIFATGSASVSRAFTGSHTPSDRPGRSTSLSISTHDHSSSEPSKRPKTEPPRYSPFSKKCYDNVDGSELTSSESQGGLSSKRNDTSSLSIEAGGSSRSQKRSFLDSERGEGPSRSPPGGQKRRKKREGSVVNDRFPCIFHAGEPIRYSHDVKRYKHISPLV